ncbi:MAG: hypothetical protein R6X31_00810 [Anaerolineae bacterium]
MAYSDLGAVSPGDPGTSTWANQVRANFQASVPDIFTTKGDLAAATGADAAARVAVGADDATLVADSGEAGGLAWQIQPACRVYNSANIDPAVSTWETLTFDSERFDTDTMHSTVSNTGRITVPANGDGLYLLGACVEFPNSTPIEECGLRFQLNGATVIERVYLDQDSTTANNISLNLSTLYSLSATDYVVVQVYVGADENVLASSNYSPEFWAIWQRRA